MRVGDNCTSFANNAPFWLWTTAGWRQYVDHPSLGYSNYSGGAVSESNVRTLLAMAREQTTDTATVDGPYHLSTLNNAREINGSGYIARGMEPPYLIKAPEPAQVIEYIGGYGTHGVYLLADDPWCEEQLAALENYPLLDDDDHSELEEEKRLQAWGSLSMRDRIDLIKRYRDAYGASDGRGFFGDDTISIFAARRDYPPSDHSGWFDEQLIRGDGPPATRERPCMSTAHYETGGLFDVRYIRRVRVTAEGERAMYQVLSGKRHTDGVLVIALVPVTGGDVARSDYTSADYQYSHGGSVFVAACDRARAILTNG